MKSWIFILQTWTTFNIPITLSIPGVSVHRHRSWCEPLLRSFSIASALCLHSPTEGSKVRCRHSLSLHFFPKRLAYNMSIKLWRHNPENARIMRVHPKNKISKLLCLSVFLVCLAASPSPFCLWPRVCVCVCVCVQETTEPSCMTSRRRSTCLPLRAWGCSWRSKTQMRRYSTTVHTQLKQSLSQTDIRDMQKTQWNAADPRVHK